MPKDIQYKNLSDEGLVKKIVDGDMRAEGELYKRFYEYIDSMIYSRLSLSGKLSLKEDVRQNVWEEVIITLRKNNYKPEKFELGLFLWGIVKNTVFKINNKENEMTHVEFNEAVSNRISRKEYQQEVDYNENENWEKLNKILKTSSKKNRDIIELYYFQELKHEQISRKLDINESTSRGRMASAFGQIRKRHKKNK